MHPSSTSSTFLASEFYNLAFLAWQLSLVAHSFHLMAKEKVLSKFFFVSHCQLDRFPSLTCFSKRWGWGPFRESLETLLSVTAPSWSMTLYNTVAVIQSGSSSLGPPSGSGSQALACPARWLAVPLGATLHRPLLTLMDPSLWSKENLDSSHHMTTFY